MIEESFEVEESLKALALFDDDAEGQEETDAEEEAQEGDDESW